MRKVLNKLFRMPFFVWSFHIVFRISFIISLPILLIIKLPLMLVQASKSDEQTDKERKALTEKEIKDMVRQWSAKHTDKIKFIDSKQFENKKYKFTWLELSVVSYNTKIMPLKLSIGGPSLLQVSIGNDNDVCVEYDTNNGTHNYSINAIELECLLNAYLNGDYYIVDWLIDDNNVIDKHLYIKNPQGTYTTNSYDLGLAVQRKLSTERRTNFKPI